MIMSVADDLQAILDQSADSNASQANKQHQASAHPVYAEMVRLGIVVPPPPSAAAQGSAKEPTLAQLLEAQVLLNAKIAAQNGETAS
jgi:hypothetical protein